VHRYAICDTADSEELAAERESLSNAAGKLRSIIAQVQEEDRHLKEDNDSVGRRLEELEKYQQQLCLQEKILRDKIQGYENENNELDSNINELCENLAELELAIKKAQEELADLQQAVSEIGLLNDKYRTETQHAQKATQAETLRSNALAKDLKAAEYTQKVRTGQVD
jgi:chromosome segregation ATPase